MLRLEERLQVNWSIEQVDVLDIMLPSLTLRLRSIDDWLCAVTKGGLR